MNEQQEKEYFEDLRAKLLRKHAFFGSVLHRTKLLFSTDIPTASTNGYDVKFNKKFMEENKELSLTVLAHEILHCVFFHPRRTEKLIGFIPPAILTQEQKNKTILANLAGDLLINFLLKEFDFYYEEGKWEYNPNISPDKYTLEDVFYMLLRQAPKDKGGGGQDPKNGEPDLRDLIKKYSRDDTAINIDIDISQGTKSNTGSHPTEQDLQDAEQEVRGIIQAAAESLRKAGKGSAILDRMIELWSKVEIPWEVVLEDWMMRKTKDETTWRKPHRRSSIIDIYLPSKSGTSMGHVGIAVDLSGSISQKEISYFLGHIQYIFNKCKPQKATIITFADGVIDTFELDDLPIDVSTLKIRGTGGTDFVPVFKAFDDIADSCVMEDMKFEGLVFMTDLCGPFPNEAPNYPVIFLSTYPDGKAPFGEVVQAKFES